MHQPKLSNASSHAPAHLPLKLDRMEIEEAGAAPFNLAAAIHAQLPSSDKAIPIEAIALALDIVEIRKEPTTSFEGALIMTPGRGQGMILVNSRSSYQRQRFTIAHELGHFLNIWHRPTNPEGGFTCKQQDLTQAWTKRGREQDIHMNQENEANRFAIELLAPKALLKPYTRGIPDLEHIDQIAKRFELSREASARRYLEIRDEPLALVFSQNDKVRYTSRSDTFPTIGLRQKDAMPSIPTLQDGTSITNHDEADPRDWGISNNSNSLIIQTLHQSDGYAMTLLAFEEPED